MATEFVCKLSGFRTMWQGVFRHIAADLVGVYVRGVSQTGLLSRWECPKKSVQ